MGKLEGSLSFPHRGHGTVAMESELHPISVLDLKQSYFVLWASVFSPAKREQ